jgi:hypothetical protein
MENLIGIEKKKVRKLMRMKPKRKRENPCKSR